MTGLPSGLTAADFEFRAGNLGSPAGWGNAPPPASISVRPGRRRRRRRPRDAHLARQRHPQPLAPGACCRPRPRACPLPATCSTRKPRRRDGNFSGVGHKVDPGDLNATRARRHARPAADLSVGPQPRRLGEPRRPGRRPAQLRARRCGCSRAPLVGGLPSAASQPVVVPAEANAGSSGRRVRERQRHHLLRRRRRRSRAGAVDDRRHAAGHGDGRRRQPRPASSSPRQFENVGGVAVFAADDGTHGEEPWRSDGTPAGTYLLDDVNPGRDSSDPWAPSSYDGSRRAIVIGGVMYFFANRPGEGTNWKRTDGTGLRHPARPRRQPPQRAHTPRA